MELGLERALRDRIMRRLDVLVANQGYVTRDQLSALQVDGETYRLIDTSKGIWNPRSLSATLSVVSSPDGPYDDRELDGALFRYAYRAGSVEGDNTKLRRAMELQLPIILLRKTNPGEYVPIHPVYVIEDDLARREFVLALNELVVDLGTTDSLLERAYVERLVKQRLHQAEFRGRVLRAYETQCTICNLKLGRLLEAAHITPDAHDGGAPVVTNGLSLCRIHHGAYDAGLVGISPDYVVALDHELIDAVDGPMLRHGLQAMHGRQLTLPRRASDRPDRDRLAIRWETFRLGA